MSTAPEKPGGPPCGIYYRIAPERSFDDALFFIRRIGFVINQRSGYEKNMSVIEIAAGKPRSNDELSQLIAATQEQGLVSVLLQQNHDDLNDSDGLLVSTIDDLIAARQSLGNDPIIGLSCLSDRKKAEEALLHKADYVSFGIPRYGLPDIKLIQWWASQTDKPAVACGEITNDTAGLFAKAGAGFIDASGYIDSHEEGPMKAVVNLLYALELATQKA